MSEYVTKQDIVIPKGTVVTVNTPHRRNFFVPFASILTAVTKDTTSEWQMPLDEALRDGLIEAMKPETAK